MKISVVSPVYQAEAIVEELVGRIMKAMTIIGDSYEIVLVDDGSADDSWTRIVGLTERFSEVKGVKLSRNFGQHCAIVAGLEQSKGEWVVVMDCDLQDDPDEIQRLYEKAQSGYHVVFARRENRQDSVVKRAGSKAFYSVLSYLTDYHQDETVANFGVYHRDVIDHVAALKEHVRWFPLNVKWVGFRTTYLQVKHRSRHSGESNYSIWKRLNLALTLIVSFSDKPLRLTAGFGLINAALAVFVAVYFVILSFFVEIPVVGWLSLIVSTWFLLSLIITSLGVVGLYIGRILEEVKGRPLYIIETQTKNKK